MLKSGKICKNNDHTCLFHALTLVGSLGRCLNTRPIGLVLKQLSRDRAPVLLNPTCLINSIKHEHSSKLPYISYEQTRKCLCCLKTQSIDVDEDPVKCRPSLSLDASVFAHV